jgi:tetratricopeptide (TPR) repeat protein
MFLSSVLYVGRRVLTGPVDEGGVSGKAMAPKFPWIPSLTPVLLTLIAYFPVFQCGFTNWDDDRMILDNPHLQHMDVSFFLWMFTTFLSGNWIPLTWFSLALDRILGGSNPWFYHLHNLILHLANTFLVFFVSFKTLILSDSGEGKRNRALAAAFLTSALFGLHPLHVESVAWVTERKDVLYGFFFLLSLLLYLDGAARGRWKGISWKLSLACFTLSLMAKPMAATLPLILLLLDAWPLKRLAGKPGGVFLEKIPFFLISVAGGIITLASQNDAKAIGALARLTLDVRIMNAFHSLVFYVWKMVLPLGLHPLYLYPKYNDGIGRWVPVILVASVGVVCFLWRKAKPYLGIAWLYYFFTLLPVLGLLSFGFQSAADRYTYLPCLGPFLLFSAGIGILLQGRPKLFILFSILLAAVLGTLTLKQVDIWKDSVSLWENEVQTFQKMANVDETAYIAYDNLAQACFSAGRYEDALRAYDSALAYNPDISVAHLGKGVVFLRMGNARQSVEECQKAAALDPQEATAPFMLSRAYHELGLVDEETLELEKTVGLKPDFVEALVNLGVLYAMRGQYADAGKEFQVALALDPANPQLINDMALLRQKWSTTQAP